jgi:serine/threonine protein kinase
MIDRVGQRFGDYRLKRLLSDRGAFADVYEGEHVADRTKAAVKIWKVQIEAKTFLNDVRAAVLRHAHIVEILDFNIKGDIPYLVMAFAPNGSLQAQSLPLPLDSIVAYVQQIADALHHAHKRGIVHRDIKPDNILLGPQHEIWVGDFGIATSSLTRQDTLLGEPEKRMSGTPDYMAPEQWEDQVSPASDQYALGVMVYEWLCGERPFRGNWVALYQKHTNEPPPPLCEKQPMISPAVEQVVMKALAKDPSQRFTNIQAFATALEQASQSIMILKAQIGTTFFIYRHHKSTVSALAWSPNNQYIASGDDNGVVHIWDFMRGTTFSTFSCPPEIAALKWSPDSKQVASINRYGQLLVWDLVAKNAISTLDVKGGYDAAWSLDGKRIAIVSGNIWIIDAATGRRIVTWNANPTQYRNVQTMKVAWSPDGKYVASVHNAGGCDVWDAATGTPFPPAPPPPPGAIIVDPPPALFTDLMEDCCVAWSPDGTQIAYGLHDSIEELNGLYIRRAITGQTVFSNDDVTFDVAWAPDNTYIVSASVPERAWRSSGYSRGDKVRAWVWNTTNGEPIYTYREHLESVTKVSWSSNGAYIASASRDNTVHIWQAK